MYLHFFKQEIMHIITLCDLTLTKSVTKMFIHVQSQCPLDLD